MTASAPTPLLDPLDPSPCGHRVRALAQAGAHPRAAAVFTRLDADAALAVAQQVDASALAGPLLGWLVSLKDNLDVAGQVTTAGSRVCEADPPAVADAPVVARLRAAGAVLVGRTNMTEFAFSGVGINPHHGTPVNPCDADVARIPGGSSAGAAVSVALGLVRAGIGTDTGGSVRIPAALCGLVGFKASQSRIPTQGVLELSRSLDTVGAITRSVADNLCVDAVLSQDPLPSVPAVLRGRRFALPQTVLLDDLSPEVARAFARALSRLSQAGAELVELPFTELGDIAPRSQPAGISPIEAYAAHHHRWAKAPERVDPRVLARMQLGANVAAHDYLRLLDARRDWIASAHAVLHGFDALLCPTVPITAPAIAPLLASDAAFFEANRLLLRNPSVINYLDGCAFSLPCHAPGELPVGLMLAAPHGADAHLAGLALSLESLVSPAQAAGSQDRM